MTLADGFETLTTELRDRVLLATLNRPDHLNTFTVAMADELEALFWQASEDDEVGAIVVTGAGRAFCAGMDLSVPGNVFGLNESLKPTLGDLETRLADSAIHDGVRDTGGRVSLAVFACKKPVIAAINGPAVGIGATMTLPMDVRLVSDRARIGFVFGKLGVTPEACSTWFLPRLVGPSQAMEWIYSGEIFDAGEAVRAGLAKAVVTSDRLVETAIELAKRFVSHRSPVSIALTRQMLLRNGSLAHPLDAHRIESLAMFYTSIGDGKEGVRSFLEKRDPDFSGKASEMPPFYPWWDV